MKSVIANRVRSPIAMPRRGRFPVYAEAPDVSAVLARFDTYAAATKEAAAKSKAEMDLISKEVDKLNVKLAGLMINGVRGQAPGRDPSKPISPILTSFMRTGGDGSLDNFVRREASDINASMGIGSDPDGGYTVIPEMDTTIATLARDISPMRQISTVRQIRADSLKSLVETSLPLSGWGGEQQARNQTAASQLAELIFPACEMWAMPAATQTLLDDSSTDIGQWLAERVAVSFSLLEGPAFISGDGVLKPRGILSYGAESGVDFARTKFNVPQYVAAGGTAPTSAQLAAALITLSTTLREPYNNSNTRWIMNRNTKVALRGLTYSSTDNRLLWSTDGRYVDPANDQLLGIPAVIDPSMPDIAANSFPVAIGDFKTGYLIVDRFGMRVLRDPFTAKPFVLFYCTKRVGAGVRDWNSYKLMKCSAS